MKTVIIYGSKHHGNTKKVCERIAAECGVTLINATEVTKEFDFQDYDLIGFASGIAFKKFYEPVNAAAAMLPELIRSSYAITSALMKPRSKSEWIFPAAWGAFVPLVMVHALDSVGPAVR